jgi:hypothetical protein
MERLNVFDHFSNLTVYRDLILKDLSASIILLPIALSPQIPKLHPQIVSPSVPMSPMIAYEKLPRFIPESTPLWRINGIERKFDLFGPYQ